jgi:hydrogenase 3 maturation protease
MQSLSLNLKDRLVGAKKIAILVIGSELRADDAAGILIGEALGKELKDSKTRAKTKVFFGGTAPENLTGAVKDFKATHVIIIDAADMGKKPGEVHLFDPEKIEGVSFCTHSLPINILAGYLVEFLSCQIIMIGIQPKTIEFGKPVSKEVAKSIKSAVNVIKDVIINI